MSEFAVLGSALLWVYLRRNEYFKTFRNWVLLAAAIGFIGYVVYPTAPPRMFPGAGFGDTLAQFGSLNHGSGVIELASNQYAAMPSLHAADALIVGITMAYVVRRWWFKGIWLLWPAWVCFSVIGYRQPLLARLPRRRDRRAPRGRHRLPRCDPALAERAPRASPAGHLAAGLLAARC